MKVDFQQILTPLPGESQENDYEETSKEDDKYAGLYLYARFHSYYHSLLAEDSDLESVHFKILEDLRLFVDVYLNRNKDL